MLLAVLLAYSAAVENPPRHRAQPDGRPGLRGAGHGDRRGRADSVTRSTTGWPGQWEAWFGSNPGLLLTGGIAALIYAYLARFPVGGAATVETSLSRSPQHGRRRPQPGPRSGRTLRRVHLPILRGSLFTAGLLVSWM